MGLSLRDQEAHHHTLHLHKSPLTQYKCTYSYNWVRVAQRPVTNRLWKKGHDWSLSMMQVFRYGGLTEFTVLRHYVLRDISRHRFWYPQGLLERIPIDTEGWLRVVDRRASSDVCILCNYSPSIYCANWYLNHAAEGLLLLNETLVKEIYLCLDGIKRTAYSLSEDLIKVYLL